MTSLNPEQFARSFGDLIEEMNTEEIREFVDTLRSFPVDLVNLSAILDEVTHFLDGRGATESSEALARELSPLFYEIDSNNGYYYLWAEVDEDSGVFKEFPDDEILVVGTGEIGRPEQFVRLEAPLVRAGGVAFALGFFVRHDLEATRISRFTIDSLVNLTSMKSFLRFNNLKRDLHFLRTELSPEARYGSNLSITYNLGKRYFDNSYEKHHFLFSVYVQDLSIFAREALAFLRLGRPINNLLTPRTLTGDLTPVESMSEAETRAALIEIAEELVRIASNMTRFSELLYGHFEALINGATHWNEQVISQLFKALDAFLLDASEENARAYYAQAMAYQKLHPKRTWILGKSRSARSIGSLHEGDLKRAMNKERSRLAPLLEDIEIQALFKGWDLAASNNEEVINVKNP